MILRIGEAAQSLRALAAPPEDLGAVHSTQMVAHNIYYTLSFVCHYGNWDPGEVKEAESQTQETDAGDRHQGADLLNCTTASIFNSLWTSGEAT